MEISINQNILTITFDQKIDFTISSFFEKTYLVTNTNHFQFIDLNFSKTKFITLPGAMYILFLVSGLINNRKRNGLYLETIISGYSEYLLHILLNFGFISTLRTYGNLKSTSYVDELNEKKMHFWRKAVKKTDFLLDSLYWPIAIIPNKTSDSFLSDSSTFINNFTIYFQMLVDHEMIEILEAKKLENLRKDFIRSVNESTKNVWDHSESWGAASIYSNRVNKTTFCLFDYGVGFINSYIKRKGIYERNEKNDIAILEWLFKEGNTSDDINNFGRGLPRIAKFVFEAKGLLMIKTDKYILSYNYREGLKIGKDSFFPGSQIMINF